MLTRILLRYEKAPNKRRLELTSRGTFLIPIVKPKLKVRGPFGVTYVKESMRIAQMKKALKLYL
jgi:hypothetical protein